MKKLLSILFALMLMLTGCGPDTNTSHVQRIKDSGTLILLTEATFPPFEYQDTSDRSVDGVAGVDIEFGKRLAEKLGVELQVLNLDFNTLVTALNNGRGDLIAAGMTILPERAEVIDFSDVYYENGLVLVVPQGSSITSLDDLEGKSVAVQQGTTGHEVALGIEGANVMEFRGMVEAGIAVSNGRADATIMDILPATVITNNQENLMMVEGTLTQEDTALAVPQGSDLLPIVNEMIAEVKASGELDEWFDFHFNAVTIED